MTEIYSVADKKKTLDLPKYKRLFIYTTKKLWFKKSGLCGKELNSLTVDRLQSNCYIYFFSTGTAIPEQRFDGFFNNLILPSQGSAGEFLSLNGEVHINRRSVFFHGNSRSSVSCRRLMPWVFKSYQSLNS